MSDLVETICALSTPTGRSALALIRISGPHVSKIMKEVCGEVLEVRRPLLKTLKDGAGALLDEAVVTYYQAPLSYTGEDMLEISCHGNPIIVERVLSHLVSRETRLAEPGEFTRRALVNQKMSLDQVESLDLILNAPTRLGVERALRAKLGGIADKTAAVKDKIYDLMVNLQSQLDFSEEEVGPLERSNLSKALLEIAQDLKSWALAYQSSRGLWNSWVVAMVGPPNSGKSSIFNSLVGQNKAIVFNQPGTTRDYLEHSLEIGGKSITVVDTAGIRDNPEEIERLGILKTLEVMESADQICWISDSDEPTEALKERFSSKIWLRVQSKQDIRDSAKAKAGEVWVSSLTGAGLETLRTHILPVLGSEGDGFEDAGLTSARQAALAMEASALLSQSAGYLVEGGALDLVVERVLSASKGLEGITGSIPNEAVLAGIFARFCIGK